jgi:hypothetical protein
MADELTLAEFALLALTNDSPPSPEAGPLILTTKSTYLWSAAIALLVEHTEFDETKVIDAYTAALQQIKRRPPFALQLDSTPNFTLDTTSLTGSIILQSFMRKLQPEDREQRLYSRIHELAAQSYESLLQRGLVEDPAFMHLAGWVVAVVGLLPYSFTSRTQKGGRVYRKIESIMWSYEQTKTRTTNEQKIRLRLWKILTTFRQALADEADAHEKGEQWRD